MNYDETHNDFCVSGCGYYTKDGEGWGDGLDMDFWSKDGAYGGGTRETSCDKLGYSRTSKTNGSIAENSR